MLSLRDVCVLVIIQSSLVLSMKSLQDSSEKLVKKEDGLFYRLFKRELNCGPYIGEYPAEKHCCKKCKKGTYVESDCNVTHGEPVCKICTDGVDFMDEDSGSTECHRCQPCESATGHEVLHKCTVSQNTVCKCKDGFFCSDGLSPNGNCNRCSHCKECAHGVAEQCTSTKDTVCQDVHAILWPVLAVVVVLIIIGGVIYYKKRREKKQISKDPAPPGENDVTVQLINHKPICPPELQNIHLENHLYDISGIMAEESVLKLVSKKMSSVDIDNIKKDHQNDTSERKYELLKKWYTQNGSQGALKTLWERATTGEVEKIIELPDIVSLLGTHVPKAI